MQVQQQHPPVPTEQVKTCCPLHGKMGECIRHNPDITMEYHENGCFEVQSQSWGKSTMSYSVMHKTCQNVNVLIGDAITGFPGNFPPHPRLALEQTCPKLSGITTHWPWWRLGFPKVMLILSFWTWDPVIKIARIFATVLVIPMIIPFNFHSNKVHQGVKATNCFISCTVSHSWSGSSKWPEIHPAFSTKPVAEDLTSRG